MKAMQKTTAQSQQESQKTRARLVLFWKPFYKKKNMRAFYVARPRQRNSLSNNVTNNV